MAVWTNNPDLIARRAPSARYQVAVSGNYAASRKTFAERKDAVKSMRWWQKRHPGLRFRVVRFTPACARGEA